MELILSDEQRLLSDSAEKFFARLGGVKRARELRNGQAGFDRDSLRKIADNGWLGMLVPEKDGGQALGPSELALVMQQAGRALAPEPIASVALAALMLSESNDAALRDGLLRPLVAGESVIAPALQDPSGDPDLTETDMKAERRGGEWRLTGSKGFVLHAGACDGFLVSARDAEGLVICHVPRGAAGLDIRLSQTVEGRSYGELTLRDVPSSRIVARGNTASAMLDRHLGLALVAAAAEMLGVMEAVIALTLGLSQDQKAVRPRHRQLSGVAAPGGRQLCSDREHAIPAAPDLPGRRADPGLDGVGTQGGGVRQCAEGHESGGSIAWRDRLHRRV